MTNMALVNGAMANGAAISSFTSGTVLTLRQNVLSTGVNQALIFRQRTSVAMLTAVTLTLRQNVTLKSSLIDATAVILRQNVIHTLAENTQITLRQDIEDV